MKTLLIFILTLIFSIPVFGNTVKTKEISSFKLETLNMVKEKTDKKRIKKIRQVRKDRIKRKRKSALTGTVNRRFRNLERQKRRRVIGGINPRDQKKIKNKRNERRRQRRIAKRGGGGLGGNLPPPP